MKYVANIITSLRIVAAAVMLFAAPLSILFFVFYTVGGVSDVIDGTVARKLGTVGSLGARLDSIADLAFFISAAVALLPSLWALLPVYALWEVCVIAGFKCVTAVFGAVKFRKPCFLHTYMNKLTGAVVFLLPYFFFVSCFAVLVYVVCAVAFLAAIEEFICALRMKKYNPDVKGLFIFFS